jgi:hypothetical protein
MHPSRQSAIKPSHVYAIDALVAETHRPIGEVAEMYMRELLRLRVGARIEDYLVVLASRHAREALRRSAGSLVPVVAFNSDLRHLEWPITPPPAR